MSAFEMEKITARFEDNPSLKGREDCFVSIEAKVDPVLASWRESLFAHEWLYPDGTIRKIEDMSEKMQEKRRAAEEHLDSKMPVPRPVLGIGITDSLEIGSGRDVFLSLAARGIKVIPVHVPKSHLSDFRIFTF